MVKSVFGVILALGPILYCGGLLYYFIDFSGSAQQAERDGLGPTLLGLGTVGLLFCIPLIVKIVRIFTRPGPPGSGGRGGSNRSTHNGEGEFDADAVVFRYIAHQSAEAAPGSPAGSRAHEGGGPAKRPSFGRNIR